MGTHPARSLVRLIVVLMSVVMVGAAGVAYGQPAHVATAGPRPIGPAGTKVARHPVPPASRIRALAAPATPVVSSVPGTNILRAVACASAASRVAVGATSSPGARGVVVPIINGVAGQVQTVSGVSALSGVACPSTSTCVAVGSASGGGPVVVSIVDGVVGSIHTGTAVAQLSVVACGTVSSCVAVGNDGNSGRVVPITDGVPGQALTPSGFVGQANGLRGVACPAGSSSCVAVGFDGTPSGSKAVMVPITGGVPGQVQPVPGVSAGPGLFAELGGVTCPTRTDCLAVGADQKGLEVVPITNGAAGPVQTVSGAGTLNSVACASRTSCVAAGSDFTQQAAPNGILVPISNGVAGTVQTISGITSIGVACGPAATNCVGVGSTAFSQGSGAVVYPIPVTSSPNPPPVVNSTADGGAVMSGRAGCDTGQTVTVNGRPKAECTLRAAIEAENAGSVTDTSITFALPAGVPSAGVIQLATLLPALTADGVTLDGTTGPGGTVTLDASNLSAATTGLHITGGHDVVQGFVFQFIQTAILVDSPSGNDVVRANVIGLNSSGGSGVATGVDVEGSPNNLIGGTTTADRNVISAVSLGMLVHKAGSVGNRIQGNYLGVSANGTIAVADFNGVVVIDASNTTIGGVAAKQGQAPGNVIDCRNAGASGCVTIGGLTANAAGNAVQGNLIGLLPDGITRPAGSNDGASSGVIVTGRAANNVIGGTTPAAGNVIDNGRDDGVFVDGTLVTGTQILGNLIGTDASGQVALDTLGTPTGISVNGARFTTVGAPGAGRNVITAQHIGVGTISTPTPVRAPAFGNVAFPGTTTAVPGVLGTIIAGDTIGPLADGRSVPANGAVQADGVVLGGAGDTLGPNNLISWNAVGVGVGAGGETILGNQIGTDATGLNALPNGTGALVGGSTVATQDLIGVPGARANTISGNLNNVVVAGATTIQNNQIGTTILGLSAITPYAGTLPQAIGDGAIINFPVALASLTAGNLIGGDRPGMGNILSGNGRDGLDLFAPTVVQGNDIGTAADGKTPIPNGRYGIAVDKPSFIGAAPPDATHPTGTSGGNVIANNVGGGIDITTAGEPTSILSNSVYANTGGGVLIQGGGPAPPQIFSATQDGAGQTLIGAAVPQTAANGSVVQFFVGDSCTQSPQGKTLLATIPVLNGVAVTFVPVLPVGTSITTTFTTTPAGGAAATSPFSTCAAVTAGLATINPVTVTPGSTATATGIGFQPGQNVTATLNSAPIDLGTHVADTHGKVTFTFTVPADFALGHHDVVFTAANPHHLAAAGFTVIARGTTPTPTPPSNSGSGPHPTPNALPASGATTMGGGGQSSTFATGPGSTVTAASSRAAPATPAAGTGPLALTGISTQPILLTGFGLILLGIDLVLLGRHRLRR